MSRLSAGPPGPRQARRLGLLLVCPNISSKVEDRESRPVRQRGKIIRPIDTPRLTAASIGVSRKMGEVLNHAGADWEPRLLANLYAAAALAADDAHGDEHGLISSTTESTKPISRRFSTWPRRRLSQVTPNPITCTTAVAAARRPLPSAG
jgi:hypothetical protein